MHDSLRTEAGRAGDGAAQVALWRHAVERHGEDAGVVLGALTVLTPELQRSLRSHPWSWSDWARHPALDASGAAVLRALAVQTVRRSHLGGRPTNPEHGRQALHILHDRGYLTLASPEVQGLLSTANRERMMERKWNYSRFSAFDVVIPLPLPEAALSALVRTTHMAHKHDNGRRLRLALHQNTSPLDRQRLAREGPPVVALRLAEGEWGDRDPVLRDIILERAWRDAPEAMAHQIQNIPRPDRPRAIGHIVRHAPLTLGAALDRLGPDEARTLLSRDDLAPLLHHSDAGVRLVAMTRLHDVGAPAPSTPASPGVSGEAARRSL